mgnify:FL=1
MAAKIFIRVIATAFLIVISFASSATTEEEKVELKNFIKEVSYLKARVVEMRKLQRVDDMEKVDYSALLRDLQKISDGVKRHVEAPSRQPRVIEPLEGDYGSIR